MRMCVCVCFNAVWNQANKAELCNYIKNISHLLVRLSSSGEVSFIPFILKSPYILAFSPKEQFLIVINLSSLIHIIHLFQIFIETLYFAK